MLLSALLIGPLLMLDARWHVMGATPLFASPACHGFAGTRAGSFTA
jgi:hypothetical protein